MSYILDALKKAEQERRVSWQPQPAAVSDGPLRRRRPAASAIAALALVAVAVASYFFLARTPAASDVARSPQALPAVAQDTTQPPPPVSPPSPSAAPLTPPPPVVAQQTRPPEQTVARVRPAQAEATEQLSAPDWAARRAGARKIPEAAAVVAAAVPEQPHSETSPPATVVNSAPQSPATVAPAVPPVSASPVTAQDRPARLQEAVAKMKLTLLAYSDAEAERVVYINGKKYVKGDAVDGLYVVESITPEGVLLSWEGQRALLRP
jgi:general secretion pathway protein B